MGGESWQLPSVQVFEQGLCVAREVEMCTALGSWSIEHSLNVDG